MKKFINLIFFILKKPRFYKYATLILLITGGLVGVVWISYWLLLLLILITFLRLLLHIKRLNFDYPVKLEEKSFQVGLYYFIDSDALFLDNICEDDNCVAINNYGSALGYHYNPAYIAWYGLANLQKHLITGDKECLEKFLIQVNWLKTNYENWGEKGYVWTYNFDWQENRAHLKAPWVSAMAQGLAVSALVRAYRLNGNKELLNIAVNATRIFEFDIAEDGVKSTSNGLTLYEEYPVYPLARVLDGFCFSLLGLYDLYQTTGDTKTYQLFNDGVNGLKEMLALWDYREKWTWYGCDGYLCPPKYNKLNALMLEILYRITNENSFQVAARSWMPSNLKDKDKIEIYIVHKVTLLKVKIKKILFRLEA